MNKKKKKEEISHLTKKVRRCQSAGELKNSE